MNVLFVSSEVTPFAKTGGLADVCGSLPVELARQGHSVSVIMPAHRSVWNTAQQLQDTGIRFEIPLGTRIVSGKLWESHLPGSTVPIYFIDQPDYFDRPELYRERGEDYGDNCERFIYFCRAALEAVRALKLNVNVIHCHDWQTGLIPAYLKIEYRHSRLYEQITSVFTIHNLAYQGQFWHWDMPLTGLDWKYFNYHQMEFYGNLNLLKTGLVFADALTTVSPTYAREIQTAEQGYGLDAVLRLRKDALTGIVNGVDEEIWNPATDRMLASRFDVGTWPEGKATCKQALQKEFNLPQESRTPIIGLIGRLAEQKGWDLIGHVIDRWAPQHGVQWVILGTGEPRYHDWLQHLARTYPWRVSVKLSFSEELAHRIEAGADMFLMPSRYEPCGLNQLYSLKYGTVPIVRSTGGLADTVVDSYDETLANGTATGFNFHDYNVETLEQAVWRACDTYWQRPETWTRIVTHGMSQDWSWRHSAQQYVQLYRQAIQRHREQS